MSDYTPETAEVRAAWLDAHRTDAEGGGFEREGRPLERLREFDRWLALIIEGAEQRGAVKAGRAMLEQAVLDMDTEFGAHL